MSVDWSRLPIKRIYLHDTLPGPHSSGKLLEVEVDGKSVRATEVPHGYMLTGPKRTVLATWSNIKGIEYRPPVRLDPDPDEEPGGTPEPQETSRAVAAAEGSRRLPKA